MNANEISEMPIGFRPMLAADAELDKLRYPLLASAKLDGVRAIVRNGIVLSRSLKPIPNDYAQKTLGCFEGFDGELIVGSPTSKTVYRDTVSCVMSHDKTDYELRYYVFDHVRNPTERYHNRLLTVRKHSPTKIDNVIIHPQHIVTCTSTLLALEKKLLAQGYEGLILRDPNAPYKFGRSTVREGFLLKLKRFVDAEFEVVGFEERMHNGNEATIDELGRTKRSSHEANKTGRGDLGALVLRHPEGFTFNVGTGFTDQERAEIWNAPDAYIGRRAKIKYFAIGMKDAPRHPVFLGWRNESDT